MSDIEQVVLTAQNLCNTLDRMIEDEKKFGFEVAHQLEIMSYEAFKFAEELKAIKNYVAGVTC